jgi:NADPH-dependent 7-cyano-7-deazaguanine reductase QueF
MIKTQPNEKRCHRMRETHKLSIPPCCPVSGNPGKGSVLEISYEPDKRILEVASLRAYVDSYKGGKGDIRSMEGMIQAITQDCANAVRVMVHVIATLKIKPRQEMRLECSALVTA